MLGITRDDTHVRARSRGSTAWRHQNIQASGIVDIDVPRPARAFLY